MDRVGIVQLHELVADAARRFGLDLRIPGDPVPPHQVVLNSRAELADGTDLKVTLITHGGTSSQVAAEFYRWLDGYEMGLKVGLAGGVKKGE